MDEIDTQKTLFTAIPKILNWIASFRDSQVVECYCIECLYFFVKYYTYSAEWNGCGINIWRMHTSLMADQLAYAKISGSIWLWCWSYTIQDQFWSIFYRKVSLYWLNAHDSIIWIHSRMSKTCRELPSHVSNLRSYSFLVNE